MKHFRSYCDQRHAPLSPNRYYRVAVEKEAKWAVVGRSAASNTRNQWF